MNNLDDMPSKCQNCTYWERAEKPYYCDDCINRIERKEDIKYCKDCYWYSDVTVKRCERDSFDPCNPEHFACSLFEPKED